MSNIPIYNAVLDGMDEGVFCISFVDAPAVDSNFLAFSKNKGEDKKKEVVVFSVENEEKHDVLGCVLRADYPIYRIDEWGNEYYINFTKEVIEQITERMYKYGTMNYFDKNHDCCDIPSGVSVREMFIKNIDKGINPIGFEDVADGSLFMRCHIDSMELWDQIKDGTFRGFSVEAWLSLEQINMNKINKDKKLNTMSKVKDFLKKMLASFGEVKAVDGTVIEYEGELEVGTEVEVADGEYELEDGRTIVVADGKVTEIREKSEEPSDEVTDEPKEDEEVNAEDEKDEEPKDEEPKDEDENDDFDAKAEVEALKAEIESLKEIINKIMGEPKADPVVEEFEKAKQIDSKKSRAVAIAEALHK